jgi:hypothetical protein
MDSDAVNELVERARSDPEFFHALVFKTEEVLSSLENLDRRSKANLVAISPEDFIGRLIGDVAGCDVTCTSSCGATCGSSCGYTTNFTLRPEEIFANRARPVGDLRAGCDVTCTSSCGATCGSSCGYTTNLVGREREIGYMR